MEVQEISSNKEYLVKANVKGCEVDTWVRFSKCDGPSTLEVAVLKSSKNLSSYSTERSAILDRPLNGYSVNVRVLGVVPFELSQKKYSGFVEELSKLGYQAVDGVLEWRKSEQHIF